MKTDQIRAAHPLRMSHSTANTVHELCDRIDQAEARVAELEAAARLALEDLRCERIHMAGDALRNALAAEPAASVSTPRPPDIRCPDCGEMMTSHVVMTRHATGPCDESFSGPELRSETTAETTPWGRGYGDGWEAAIEECAKVAEAWDGWERSGDRRCADEIRKLATPTGSTAK